MCRYNPRLYVNLRRPFRRCQIYSFILLNMADKAVRNTTYNEQAQLFEDIRFNNDVEELGGIICKYTRFCVRKVCLQRGGCSALVQQKLHHQPIPPLPEQPRIFVFDTALRPHLPSELDLEPRLSYQSVWESSELASTASMAIERLLKPHGLVWCQLENQWRISDRVVSGQHVPVATLRRLDVSNFPSQPTYPKVKSGSPVAPLPDQLFERLLRDEAFGKLFHSSGHLSCVSSSVCTGSFRASWFASDVSLSELSALRVEAENPHFAFLKLMKVLSSLERVERRERRALSIVLACCIAGLPGPQPTILSGDDLGHLKRAVKVEYLDVNQTYVYSSQEGQYLFLVWNLNC
eukprot:m.239222 g.239222  ORF g.239222 m.239222 type:complete len:349 (-) comp22516_c1_seq2:33-1079(-)